MNKKEQLRQRNEQRKAFALDVISKWNQLCVQLGQMSLIFAHAHTWGSTSMNHPIFGMILAIETFVI